MTDFLNSEDMSDLIQTLTTIGLKPVVIAEASALPPSTPAKLTDEELFRKRIAETAAAIPDRAMPQRVIGTTVVKPTSAMRPLRDPESHERGTTHDICPKCRGTGRFHSYSGRDLGDCFPCKGTGRVGPRSSYAATPAAPVEVLETKHYPNIIAAFDAVQRRGLKKAQITIGDINISLAGKASRNPGALYVKHQGEYAGKIERDKPLQISHKCLSPKTMMRLLDAIEVDPAAAITAQAKTDADRVAEAVAAGLEPVVPCCCCGILLTDPESRERGIGPICAGKWGLFGFSAPEALDLDDL